MTDISNLTATDRVRWADEHLATELDGNVVLMSIEHGTYSGLDDIASDIWRRLEQPVTVAALCDALGSVYAAEPARIERDVLTMLDDLHSKGLIEIVPAQ